ncbi:MAG: effector binding domain-containing protein [Saprospiraceae bacterium]|jgi:AraC family transcriptional regulator|nr:effector binding domain-containing protein [Saprospiraceae bacterium]
MTNGQFSHMTFFEKWAAVEVADFGHTPPGMSPLDVPGGLYAVFVHHGPASEFRHTYQNIFGT